MVDATVTTFKSIFLETSITHTLSSGSAWFPSTVINNLLFKQTGFLLHLELFPSGSAQCSIYKVTCLASYVFWVFLTKFMCKGLFLLLVLITRLLTTCSCGSSLWCELFLHL